jgi:hypothetical protein
VVGEACNYRVIRGQESVSDSISAGMRHCIDDLLPHAPLYHYAATGEMVTVSY